MDSGWAVVLGAVIALVSSAVLPWIRESFAARREERARVARGIEKGIIEVVEALMTISYARPLTTPEVAKADIKARGTVTAFELLLDVRSQSIATMLDQAFSDAASKDERLRTVARAAVPIILTGWRSGVYSGPEAFEQYASRRRDILRDFEQPDES